MCICACASVCASVCVGKRSRSGLTEVREEQGGIGCLRLQVSLCKRTITYRALLLTTTYKVMASYAFSPPCVLCVVLRACNKMVREHFFVLYQHDHVCPIESEKEVSSPFILICSSKGFSKADLSSLKKKSTRP